VVPGPPFLKGGEGIKRKTVSVHTALPQGKRDCCASWRKS